MKQTSFLYPGLEVLNSASPFGGWEVKEFALAWMNPNPQPIWTRSFLIADDPAFRYRTGHVGTLPYQEDLLHGFRRDERLLGANKNCLQVAFDETAQVHWKGSVKIESFDKDGLIALPFYSWDPRQFVTKIGSGATQAAAYNDAWQNGGPWKVPVEWDGDIGMAVCPYGNYWFGDTVWPRGWSTVVTITNNTGWRTKYTVRNHLYGLDHGTQAHPCGTVNEGVTEVSFWLNDGEQWEGNPFNVALNVRSRHDVCFSFECFPTLPGSGFWVTVVPNLVGKVLCP